MGLTTTMSGRDNQQQLGKKLRTPSGASTAVTILRQNPNDFQLLNALTNLAADPECWSYLRDAGVIDLFIDLTLRPDLRVKDESQDFPVWLLPLQGLFNGMVGVQRSPRGFQDTENAEALMRLLKAVSSICDQLFKEKDAICTSSIAADSVRKSIISWTQVVWNGGPLVGLNNGRADFKAHHIIEIATWCWKYAVSSDVRQSAALALLDLLDCPNPTRDDLNLVIIAAGSKQELIRGIIEVIDDEELVDGPLANNLSLLVGLTAQTVHMELAREFAVMKVHHHVMAGLRRQLRTAELHEDTWRAIEYCGMLIVNIVNEAVSPTEDLIALISSHSLIPLLGGVLLRSIQEGKPITSWMSFVSLLKHTCTCTSKTCRIRASPVYLSALHTHLSWRWWPTLEKLSTTKSDGSTKAQKEWIVLASLAKLNQDIEKKKFETGEGIQGCWWVECVNLVHPSDPVNNPALRKCSGCKKAIYCSSACQNSDWKEHKKKCKLWK